MDRVSRPTEFLRTLEEVQTREMLTYLEIYTGMISSYADQNSSALSLTTHSVSTLALALRVLINRDIL